MACEDPRDSIAYAEAALCGLRTLLNQQPRSESIGAHDIAALLGVIHDRMAPAAEAIQKYVPRVD